MKEEKEESIKKLSDVAIGLIKTTSGQVYDSKIEVEKEQRINFLISQLELKTSR